MEKDNIELPPLHYDELPESGDATPAMYDYARKAIKHDRQRRGEPVAWADFAGYLIDNFEGREITEERMQMALAGMLEQAPQPAAPAQEPSDDLMNALRNQRQIDRDGTEVGVSRQALDEAIALLARYGSKS